MGYWLDYSAAKISGETIKAAGYEGVIRYIDSPGLLKTKHTNLDEYRSHLAAGLSVLLVMQTTTTASNGGTTAGVDHARRALDGARYLGYNGPIFFTNDRVDLPNASIWRAYLNGAASVLGVDRVGAYGFRNALDAAVGHAKYFWQAGRRSDVAAHTHIWQDNNVQVKVGGITCDRNLIIQPISTTTGGFLMGLSDTEQRTLFNRVMGFNAQRWYYQDADGTAYEVGSDDPRAVAAHALDTLDGNFLVKRIEDLAETVETLTAEVKSLKEDKT